MSETTVNEIVTQEKERIFGILQKEIDTYIPLPKITYFVPQEIEGSKMTEIYSYDTKEVKIAPEVAVKIITHFDINRSLKDATVSLVAHGGGHWAMDYVNQFAYSKYGITINHRIEQAVKDDNQELIERLFEERAVVKGKWEGLARHCQLKVLEEYRIDSNYETIIVPQETQRMYYESESTDITTLNRDEAVKNFGMLVNSMGYVAGLYFESLLKTFPKSKIKAFLHSKPLDFMDKEKDGVNTYLSAISESGRIFNQK